MFFEKIKQIKLNKKIKKLNKKENIKNKDEIQNKENILINKIDELNTKLTKSNILEVFTLIGNKKELLIRNFLAGISRGIGIGIGVTIITAVIVILLQKIVTLNIPVIGKYIADIVQIVEKVK